MIFSDFDGVLFNTVKEAYLLSRYAYDGIDFIQAINNDEYNLFNKYRYLINKSWHFYYIFKLIKNNTSNENFETKYKEEIKKEDHKNAYSFDEKYVKGREKLLKENYDFWDDLDKPYPFFFELKKYSKNNKVVILTNKKRLPIEHKLKKYNADSFEIYTQEDLSHYKNKAEFIVKYMQEKNITKSLLIEDNIDNINDCKKYSNLISTVLVSWGYVSKEDKTKNLDEVLKEIEVIK